MGSTVADFGSPMTDSASLISRLANVEEVGGLEERLNEALGALEETEKALVCELEKQEAPFFQAIASMDSLSEQIMLIFATFEDMEEKMKKINSEQTDDLQKLHKIANDHEILLRARTLVDQCAEVLRSRQIIQNLLDTHEFSDANRIVKEKLELIDAELAGVSSLTFLSRELREMKTALDKLTDAKIYAEEDY